MFDKLMEKAFDKFTRKESDAILPVTEPFSLLFLNIYSRWQRKWKIETKRGTKI